jgi:hypothetical protein
VIAERKEPSKRSIVLAAITVGQYLPQMLISPFHIQFCEQLSRGPFKGISPWFSSFFLHTCSINTAVGTHSLFSVVLPSSLLSSTLTGILLRIHTHQTFPESAFVAMKYFTIATSAVLTGLSVASSFEASQNATCRVKAPTRYMLPLRIFTALPFSSWPHLFIPFLFHASCQINQFTNGF